VAELIKGGLLLVRTSRDLLQTVLERPVPLGGRLCIAQLWPACSLPAVSSMVALGWEGSVTILVLGLGLVVMIGDWLAPHLTFCLMVSMRRPITVTTTYAGNRACSRLSA
jgi:hypothetical protein